MGKLFRYFRLFACVCVWMWNKFLFSKFMFTVWICWILFTVLTLLLESEGDRDEKSFLSKCLNSNFFFFFVLLLFTLWIRRIERLTIHHSHQSHTERKKKKNSGRITMATLNITKCMSCRSIVCLCVAQKTLIKQQQYESMWMSNLHSGV